MSNKQSVQKAKLLNRVNTTSKNGHPSTRITYTWLDHQDGPKEMSIQWVNQFLDEDSTKVYSKLKEGDEFVLVKEEDGKFWNLKEIRDISTYVPKPVRDKGNKSSYTRQSGNKSNYDPYGATIGMMFNNAVLSSLKEKGKYDRDYTMQLAKSLVKDVQEFDSYARPLLKSNKGDNQQAENEFNNHSKMFEDKLKQESHQQDLNANNENEVPF